MAGLHTFLFHEPTDPFSWLNWPFWFNALIIYIHRFFFRSFTFCLRGQPMSNKKDQCGPSFQEKNERNNCRLVPALSCYHDLFGKGVSSTKWHLLFWKTTKLAVLCHVAIHHPTMQPLHQPHSLRHWWPLFGLWVIVSLRAAQMATCGDRATQRKYGQQITKEISDHITNIQISQNLPQWLW